MALKFYSLSETSIFNFYFLINSISGNFNGLGSYAI